MKKILLIKYFMILLFAQISLANNNLLNDLCADINVKQNRNSFIGSYIVRLKIDNTTFDDHLNITSFLDDDQNLSNNLSYLFNGSYVVKDNFTSQVERGAFIYRPWDGGVDINFKITANENGKTYQVFFNGERIKVKNTCKFIGKAFSPNYQNVLGSFEMLKISPNDDTIN